MKPRTKAAALVGALLAVVAAAPAGAAPPPVVDLHGAGVGSYALDEEGSARLSGAARRLRGTDGWISVVLATEGRATIEAIDT